MSLKIDIDITAGNIFIENIDSFEATLTKDLRNTENDWFYWQFRATFDTPGKYTFKFTNGPAIGARGPAVSYDNANTWEWLGFDCVSRENGDSFTYQWDESKPAQMIFCMGMQYLPKHLETFIGKHENSPYLEVAELERTRMNRPVELLKIADKKQPGKTKLYFASRHHACEMMATYVLEGLLETFLEESELGSELRKKFSVWAVPFTDKDGVVNGDQGKNRRPHDHARDYCDKPIYPEIKAVMNLINTEKMDFILDIHCPWLYGSDSNETVYFVGPSSKTMEAKMVEFARIFEKEAPAEAPFDVNDIIYYGFGWNGPGNYTYGKTLAKWGADLDFVKCSLSMEIPYANAREITFTQDGMRKLGRSIAVTILKYFKEH